MAAAGSVDEDGRRALGELCTQYWPPLYAFARRKGRDPESALDATQAFFLDLLSRATIERADSTRGRFRTYLLTCFANFLVNEHARTGDGPDIPIDSLTFDLVTAPPPGPIGAIFFQQVVFGSANVGQVPEPSTALLLGLGLTGLAIRKRAH